MRGALRAEVVYFGEEIGGEGNNSFALGTGDQEGNPYFSTDTSVGNSSQFYLINTNDLPMDILSEFTTESYAVDDQEIYW